MGAVGIMRGRVCIAPGCAADLAAFRQRAETDTAMNAPSDDGQKVVKGQEMSKEFADTH